MLLKKRGAGTHYPHPANPPTQISTTNSCCFYVRCCLPKSAAEHICAAWARQQNGMAQAKHDSGSTYTRGNRRPKGSTISDFFLVKGYPSPQRACAPTHSEAVLSRNPNPRRPKEGRNPKSVLKKCRRPWFGIRASDFFRISGLLVILEILVRFGDNPPGPSPGADLQNVRPVLLSHN
jgi:hypothetical protein